MPIHDCQMLPNYLLTYLGLTLFVPLFSIGLFEMSSALFTSVHGMELRKREKKLLNQL